MRIKTKIKNKFYIWMNGEIKKKYQFSKRAKKKPKEWVSDLTWKIKNKYLIEEWNNFYKKRLRKKL
jgi:hypothetical protein